MLQNPLEPWLIILGGAKKYVYTWLVVIFCYGYILSITILLQFFFPFLNVYTFFWYLVYIPTWGVISKYPMTSSNTGPTAVRIKANHCAREGSWKLPSVLFINCSILGRSGCPVGGTMAEENDLGPQSFTNSIAHWYILIAYLSYVYWATLLK